MDEYCYRIVIRGRLGPAAVEAFSDVKIEPIPQGTVLTAYLDQAGLFGMFERIQSLALELVELSRVAG